MVTARASNATRTSRDNSRPAPTRGSIWREPARPASPDVNPVTDLEASTWLRAAAGNPVLSVLALAALAVLLSICSEADAFVAASLTQFSLTAKLTFLVVGPMIDLKLFAMQTGTFGRGFALRFAPATFALAIAGAVLTGAVLL